ncbi:hypothetical protein D1007_53761 [Hordeum vulgare]|nr:hypothetical protein D1007_53761 [Hordeum vulgare]
MDELLQRDEAEEVDKPLGLVPDDGGNAGATDIGLEDGEVDVGNGVCGVVEAAAGHGVMRGPKAQDPVDLEQVGEEGDVLVLALAGPGGAQHDGEGG